MGMKDGKNGFDHYEDDIEKVWIYKLTSSYSTIAREVERHTGKRLKDPIFDISSTSSSRWGSWSPSTRIMSFSIALLRNYEWGAVEHVMKHETAHQIVSEIFDMDCYGVAHGSAWQEACKIVDIEPNRCDSATFLSGFKGTAESPMVEKIRKILIHANDKAVTKEEADTFMRKAKELMLRHDIELSSIMGSERLFVIRPFGSLKKRWDSSYWTLGALLKEHYDVEYIRTWGPNDTKRLELFGEPDKLDIAEYVGHALLNQAELLYKAHKKEVAEEKARFRMENGYGRSSKLSKRAFIEGVINGYDEKLREEDDKLRDDIEVSVAKEMAEKEGRSYTEGDRTLVPTYDKNLLKEMQRKAYPRMRHISASYSRGEGRGAGMEKGRSLTLAKGVGSSGNRGRLLAS
jgi:hypothetical protein